MKNIIEHRQWLTAHEITQLESIVRHWPCEPFRPDYGRFPGQLIANQHWHEWQDGDALSLLLSDKMTAVLGAHKIVEVDYVELFLPWDIHCESDRPIKGSELWYSMLVPLHDCASRTFIFDQTSQDCNHFYVYKKNNSPVPNPIDIDFWNENLSHCWDEDRLYLTVRYVGHEWRKGDALFFKRNHFHCSDNFHLRMTEPKRFLQILTDRA